MDKPNTVILQENQPVAYCALCREKLCEGECPWLGVEGVRCSVLDVFPAEYS